jgi:hypothetical protein
MKTMHIVRNLGLAIGAMALSVPIAWAQPQEPDQSGQPAQPSQPIPAYHSPLASAANTQDEANAESEKLLPDTTALTGIQDLSLGMPATNHSYWQPHVEVSSAVDSNPLTGNGQTGWTTFASVSGGIDLHRNSGNSMLSLSYVGGGSFSNDGNVSDGILQGLNFSERLSYRRYVLSFFDQLMYAPQTAFGAAGIPNGPTLPGQGFGNGYVPGQSILTPRGQRLTNFSAGEMDVLLTPRTSLTFVGGYQLLDSVDDPQLNYGDVIFSAGYNYQLSRQNTVGLSYQYSDINYRNITQSIKNNIISVAYGRRITGKLALQASGGPDIALIRMPLTLPPGTSGGEAVSTSTAYMTQVYASISAALQYQLKQASISAGYNHGVTPGSGVLAGAITDNFTGTVSRQVSRTFNVSGIAGYSRNRGIQIVGTTAPINETFEYWFAGANVSHPLGRTMNVFLSYQLQYQNTGASVCTGPGCAGSLTRNQIIFGFGWRKQPIPF